MLLTSSNGHRFDRNIYIFAAELYGISPAAYKMVRKSGSVVLPSIDMIKKRFNSTLNKGNLQQLIEQLLPQQQLDNILFYTNRTQGSIVYWEYNVLPSYRKWWGPQAQNIFLYARKDIIFTVDYNTEGFICFIPLGYPLK